MTRPSKPGLFITATDTGVGKTVTTCAIAMSLRRHGLRVGVLKPFATGCRREREGLVSPDAEALAHFSDCRQPLEIINPVRFAAPLAPAVAAEKSGQALAWDGIDHSLRLIRQSSDVVLVEGVGGAMVPLDGRDPKVTVLDLARRLGYPVLVVARAGLGTLNHTAMTIRLLRDAGCRVAGVAINGYEPDEALAARLDPSMPGNRQWIERMNGTKVLAVIPQVPCDTVDPSRAMLPGTILDAVAMTYWPDVLGDAGED
ncbi:MAG: dethiobiotin synthase [Phycisphaeraceae bacterium]|nr:dethiobiotin synthase [Phycisphaeraceae bacterium]